MQILLTMAGINFDWTMVNPPHKNLILCINMGIMVKKIKIAFIQISSQNNILKKYNKLPTKLINVGFASVDFALLNICPDLHRWFCYILLGPTLQTLLRLLLSS